MTERVGPGGGDPKMSCFTSTVKRRCPTPKSHETYILRRPGVTKHKLNIACLFTCGLCRYEYRCVEVNSVAAAVDSGLTFVLFTVLDLM